MKYRKQLSDILRVLSGNISTIVSGVFVSLLLPKFMTLGDYGFYKTFTLYITYAGFFSLGIPDGIILRYGGSNYPELNRPAFRAYFRGLLLIVAVFAAVVALCAGFVPEKELRFIFRMAALDLIALNLCNYFRNISQVTQRFKEFSQRTVVQSVLKTATVIAYLALSWLGAAPDFRIYLFFLVAVDFILLLWYILTYRDIVIGPSDSLAAIREPFGWMIKNGFPLLCANLTVTLIMALDRQFVSLLFDNEQYAVYAFAYNLLSLVTVAVSAISTVIYPMLKRADPDKLNALYGKLKNLMLVFVYAALASFFPLCMIIRWILPKYAASIVFFQIIFPGLAVSSTTMTVMHNYYKAWGKSRHYFLHSVCVLILAAVFNGAAYLFFGTMEAISVASIITLMLWYLISDCQLQKKFDSEMRKSLLYCVVMMAVFYVISGISQSWLGLGLYLIAFVAATLAFFRQDILHLIHKQ